jgi:hypothetical protein
MWPIIASIVDSGYTCLGHFRCCSMAKVVEAATHAAPPFQAKPRLLDVTDLAGRVWWPGCAPRKQAMLRLWSVESRLEPLAVRFQYNLQVAPHRNLPTSSARGFSPPNRENVSTEIDLLRKRPK